MPIPVTLTQMSALTGIKRCTLNSWIYQGWLPVDQPGDSFARVPGATTTFGPLTQSRILKVVGLTKVGVESKVACDLVCRDDGNRRDALVSELRSIQPAACGARAHISEVIRERIAAGEWAGSIVADADGMVAT